MSFHSNNNVMKYKIISFKNKNLRKNVFQDFFYGENVNFCRIAHIWTTEFSLQST